MTNALALIPEEAEMNRITQIAEMAVKSGLLPSAIRTKEAAVIIALKGRELGLPPMVAFSHINVIQGKPTMSAEIMLAYIYKEFPMAEICIIETTDQRCVLKAKRPHEKDFTTFTWDMERAKKMGLDQKDNWKKQPQTMLRWRCISEMKRVKFPEVLMGIDYTPEELGAELNSNGEVRDVGPRIVPKDQPVEVKTVKNFAPQTKEQAENWKPGDFVEQEKVVEVVPEEAKPAEVKPKNGREELAKLIYKEQRRIGYDKAAMASLIHQMFAKEAGDLSVEEMEKLARVLEETKL